MLSKEEIEEAKGWLSALDMKSEYGAISKEILLKYIEQLEKNNTDLQKSVEQIYDNYQDAGKEMFKYSDKINKLETKEQKLIEKLKNDIAKANRIINEQEYQYIEEVIDEQWERRKYAQEILKIVKGEKK